MLWQKYDLISQKDVAKMFGIKVRQLHALLKAGKFPEPLRAGPNTLRWYRSEITQIIDAAQLIRPLLDKKDIAPTTALPASAVPSCIAGFGDVLHEWTVNPGHCVYFLLSGEEVVYVGQTGNLALRVSSHRSAGKDFNRVFYLLMNRKHLLAAEARYIRMFRPKYNETDPVTPLMQQDPYP